MKTLLKIIGIVILIPIMLIIVILIIAAFTPAVPKNYTKTVKTGGKIEAKYLELGELTVAHDTEKVDDKDFKKHEIYYPKNLSAANYPVVLSLNGTGIAGSKYQAWFQHLASWGFIVLGNEYPSTGFGTTADEMIAYLEQINSDKSSKFYQKIDFNNIGIVGHSQGGAGVFSALSISEHKDVYKTGVALSPTHEEMAHNFGWNYELEKIKVPVLMLAGTGDDFETKAVIPIEKLNAMFDKITTNKVMARRIDAGHGQMLYSADGYVTAWLRWQLQSDVEAAKAFIGDNAEIMYNELYQDQRKELK